MNLFVRILPALAVIVYFEDVSQSTPYVPAEHTHAYQWFERRGVDFDAIKALPVQERGKRLTQAVYAFCESGTQTGDMDSLFTSCVTACGGYSYVLRGLLEASGAETRYANFYNIPDQGNHTGVEVKTQDGWGFLDPTFGAFFTMDGRADGKLMSLREVAYGVPVGDLDRHALQAPDEDRDFRAMPISDLFNLVFDHPYMKLSNYQLPERISNIDGPTFLSLDIPLDLSNGGASIGGFDESAATDASWLEATNATLNDADPINDTSFVAGLLQNAGDITRMTTISAYGMVPRKTYRIRLALRGGAADSNVEVSGVGKAVRFPSPTVIRIEKNTVVSWEAEFTPHRPSAQFQIRNAEQGVKALIRGVAVGPVR